jgi:hypothetical protein
LLQGSVNVGIVPARSAKHVLDSANQMAGKPEGEFIIGNLMAAY